MRKVIEITKEIQINEDIILEVGDKIQILDSFSDINSISWLTGRALKPDNKRDLIGIIEKSYQSEGFNVDLNFIDTAYIEDMSYLFKNSKFNGDISNWDTSNVSDMTGMFSNSSFDGDISNWDTSNVTSMKNIFSRASFSGDISNWDLSSIIAIKSDFDRDLGSRNINRRSKMTDFTGDNVEWNPANMDQNWGKDRPGSFANANSIYGRRENMIKITKEIQINEDIILEVGDKIRVLENFVDSRSMLQNAEKAYDYLMYKINAMNIQFNRSNDTLITIDALLHNSFKFYNKETGRFKGVYKFLRYEVKPKTPLVFVEIDSSGEELEEIYFSEYDLIDGINGTYEIELEERNE